MDKGIFRKRNNKWLKAKDILIQYEITGEESIKYPNLINNWIAARPFIYFHKIWFKGAAYDWTNYVDAFDNSIIGSDARN